MGALYRGLPANVIGIMPEKTIKLAGNDFFRNYFQARPPPSHVSLFGITNLMNPGAFPLIFFQIFTAHSACELANSRSTRVRHN